MRWPEGFSSAGTASGIKADGLDLGCIVADHAVDWAGVFTTNAAAAAPVQWCRSRLGAPVRALVVNSGNANACTGSAGDRTVREVSALAAASFGCVPDEVLISSTGPIGVPLPSDPFAAGIPRLADSLTPDADAFARSILTTDTCIKTATASAGDATVTGVAKGAAMIAPNMATMLAFIATDAQVPDGSLHSLLAGAVDRSFNRISVDACESTNDSVFLLASGLRPAPMDELAAAVASVCGSLAEQIVLDAEGGTKILRITVTGTSTDQEAAAIGKAVAASDLWRCAAAGGDPNWGRVLAAAGGVVHDLELSSVELSIGSALVFSGGEPILPLDIAAKEMAASDVAIDLVVGDGTGVATILSADLTTDYVRLNSEVTT